MATIAALSGQYRGQRPKMAVPVGARWRLPKAAMRSISASRGQVQFVSHGTALVTAWLAVLREATRDQDCALFAKVRTSKRRADTVAQQPLQGGAVVCFDADTGVNRKL